MTTGRLFAAIGVAAACAGAALWLATRPSSAISDLGPPSISPPAIYALPFSDAVGQTHSLAEFSGHLVVLNFWATWCAPCRAEMPAFDRVQQSWAERGVKVVGLSGESADTVEEFRRSVGVRYPLWTGGDGVSELSRRLGNRGGILPHTAIFDASGRLLEQKVGPYTEEELESVLRRSSVKIQ